MNTTVRNTSVFLLFLGAVFGVAALGSFSSVDAIDTWYRTLVRPDIAPPNYVFGPVWTVLYVCIASAGFLVWKEAGTEKGGKFALTLFAIQLVLNGLWSFLFFGMQQIGWALAEIIVLLIFIMITMRVFYEISPWAGRLFLPYGVWVAFATYLNLMFWILN